jgi:hypothetical protein
MSEHLELHGGPEIRDWIGENGFDIIDIDPDAPRFFQPRFTPEAGPFLLFGVQHTYLMGSGQPLVSLQRSFRATSAEDALRQYLHEPRERSSGLTEQRVGFELHVRPGTSDDETVIVFREPAE